MSSLFTHSIEYFFVAPVKVDQLDVNSGQKLRLPSSTWQKVSGKKSLKKLQSEKLEQSVTPINGLFNDFCWGLPVQSKVVSRFASPRTLPNGRSYFHTGVDLRAWKGTPIVAPAKGNVVLAERMVVPGNVVTLDHGGGVYSRYMHLSHFKVKLGAHVEKGEVIGLSGDTGRVEAAHLHWEVLWKGHRANPERFVASLEKYCMGEP